MVKMANLNKLFAAWHSDRSEQNMNVLLKAVHYTAMRTYRYEFGDEADDVAQIVTLKTWKAIADGFEPQTENAFSKWVWVLIKNERRKVWDKPKVIQPFEVVIEQPQEERPFFDVNTLPESLRDAARLLLRGHSIKEAASLLGVTAKSLYRRFDYYRAKITAASSSPGLQAA